MIQSTLDILNILCVIVLDKKFFDKSVHIWKYREKYIFDQGYCIMNIKNKIGNYLFYFIIVSHPR